MYTGIVQGLEKILDVRQGDGFSTLVVSNTHNFFHDVFIGASVAINGTCLTATHIDLAANQVHFDVSDLTRRLTTLGTLQAGDEVNIERSAKVGMENGGPQKSIERVFTCHNRIKILRLLIGFPMSAVA